jgi:hypothetical protein
LQSGSVQWLGPALFAASAFGACSDGEDAPKSALTVATTDAASEHHPASIDAASERDSTGGTGATGQDASERDAAPDTREQPFVACRGDAAASHASSLDAGECDLPPSRCVDARRLLYYHDGKCVDGRCRWREALLQCRYICTDNGCNDNFTAPVSP